MLNGAASHERNYQNDQQDYPEHSNEQDHGVAHSKGLEGEAQLATGLLFRSLCTRPLDPCLGQGTR
jgi:hypothetical protein